MSSKFCSLKHNQKVFILHLNSARSCCRAYPEPLLENETILERIAQWKKESELLDQGVELPNCESCWKSEKQEKLSFRQLEGQINKQFNRVEIFLSNLCNQMCSYCSPRYSSAWEESIVNQGPFEKVSNTAIKNLQISKKSQEIHTRLEQIQSYIQSCDNNSVSLALLGGEPLMQFNSLKQLLTINREKIKTLSIVTNLNPPTPKFLEWLLENFDNTKLQIQISLDSTPEYNHIPRSGFNSVLFEKNLNLVKKHNLSVEIVATVSATSIFDLSNFLHWIDQNQFAVKFTLINNPDCLDPMVVPFEIRQRILDEISIDIPPLIDQVLNYNQPMVDLKLFEQYNYLTQYFNRTNTDVTKVNNLLFQEYWQWLIERFQK